MIPQQSYRAWNSSSDGQTLKTYKPITDTDYISPSHYLYLDTPLHARTRARFRLNRVGHNASMFKMNEGKYGTTSTPRCPGCLDTDETIHHMINICPLYSLPRIRTALLTRQPINNQLSQFVLGSNISNKDIRNEYRRKQLRLTLEHTGQFLIDILTIRQLPIIWERWERAVPTEVFHAVAATFPPSHHSYFTSFKININFSLSHWTLITGLFVTYCFVADNPPYCRLPTSVTPNVGNPVYMPSGVRRVYGLMLCSRTYTET